MTKKVQAPAKTCTHYGKDHIMNGSCTLAEGVKDNITGKDILSTGNNIKIRCSALPRLMSCPASIIPPENPIETTSDIADMGTAFHAMIEDYIDNGEAMDTDVYIQQYLSGDESKTVELETLYTNGKRMIEAFALSGDIRSEVSMIQEKPGYILTGHADLIGETQDGIHYIIVDWKTGYIDRDCSDQLKGYAWLHHVNNQDTARKDYIIILANPRTKTWDTQTVTIDELQAWALQIDDIILNRDRTNPTFDNCQYCPRGKECEAVRARIAWASVAVNRKITHTPADLAAVYDMSRQLEQALDDYRAALRDAVADNGGSLDLPDGRRLVLRKQTRESIPYTAQTASIISEYIPGNTPEAVAEMLGLTISKSALTMAISKAVERGKGKETTESVLAELRDAGKVQSKEIETLAVVNKKKGE